MNGINWRALLTSILAFFFVLAVVAYGLGIVILQAFILAVVAAIGAATVNHYLRPKVKLEVTSFDIQGKDLVNIRGFQVKLSVKNRGRRIATKPTFAPMVKRIGDLHPSFLRV